jgi:hypothetical protein
VSYQALVSKIAAVWATNAFQKKARRGFFEVAEGKLTIGAIYKVYKLAQAAKENWKGYARVVRFWPRHHPRV